MIDQRSFRTVQSENEASKRLESLLLRAGGGIAFFVAIVAALTLLA